MKESTGLVFKSPEGVKLKGEAALEFYKNSKARFSFTN